MQPAVAYIRVSTVRQGRSGLGLAAQQAALAKFANAEGYTFAATHIEVESGKSDENRPQLHAAIDAAKRCKAPAT
jgi:DNA invertase Pin-like site-specific DNA recombinase